MNKQKSRPLVSIAIITYNQKSYLKACIESILSQDYSEIEIVVADDASKDGTQELLLWYEQQYPNKFKLVLGETNLGVTANSNRAHKACTGKYVAWMGGDDLMLPGKLSKQVALMESHDDCSICYHDLDVFDSESNQTLYLFSKKNKPRTGGLVEVIRYGCFNGACSTLVRRRDVPEEGFDSRLLVSSDWMYWIETLQRRGKIYYINEVLGRYRRHANNVTSVSNTNIIPQVVLDSLQTCNILLLRYPKYHRIILKRYATVIFSARRYTRTNYVDIVMTSLKMSLSLRSAAAMSAYYLSFGMIYL